MGIYWFALGWFAGDERNREIVCVLHDVCRGGCYGKFRTAMKKCGHADPHADVDAEACVKATAALRECFAGNPEWFDKEQYLRRLDEGLDQDQDTKPTPEEIVAENRGRAGVYRWWSGMRRS